MYWNLKVRVGLRQLGLLGCALSLLVGEVSLGADTTGQGGVTIPETEMVQTPRTRRASRRAARLAQRRASRVGRGTASTIGGTAPGTGSGAITQAAEPEEVVAPTFMLPSDSP
ncbi:MAG: hypothetical protein IT285_06285 [Bdellovibrionales bacterium]|nr:hypothetical protein [Bdellovibrionales bacterium]